MPPKKESNAHNSSASSSNNHNATTATTTVLDNSTTTLTAGSASTSTNTNTNSAAGAAASSASANASTADNKVPVVMPDAAAEQRTIAYQANAKLCRLVRKCPWMYDRTHHNYAKKHILDKSWCKIARECNDSVASCKERWRNIRAAFARSINIYKTHSGPNRVKPYYLHKELSFLVKPMMEGRDKEGCTKEEYTEGEEEEEEQEPEQEPEQEGEEAPPTAGEEEEELNDDAADIKSAFEALNPDISIHAEAKFHKMLKNINNALLNSNSQKNQSHNSAEYDASTAIFEPHTEFSTSDPEHDFHFPDETLSQTEAERRVAHMMNHSNATKRPMHLETETYEAKRFKLTQIPPSDGEADIRFLEALLPDMALMNTRQKIVFKRKIYQTLEEVFENSNDFPNISTNQEQLNHSAPAHLNSGHNLSSTSTQGGCQVKQTVLTVNSSTARTLINNIANLNETELQKVNGFLQSSLRSGSSNNSNGNGFLQSSLRSANSNNGNGTNSNNNNTPRMPNGGGATAIPPGSAAARLMHSTPKITITKVTCPPPASLRNMAVNKPPSPSSGTVSTTIHHTPGPVMTSNVHSTTMGNPQTSTNNTNVNSSPWSQLLPIAIKDEVEDVDID